MIGIPWLDLLLATGLVVGGRLVLAIGLKKLLGKRSPMRSGLLTHSAYS